MKTVNKFAFLSIVTLVLFLTTTGGSIAGTTKSGSNRTSEDKGAAITQSIKLAEQLHGEGKTRKAINELEKILPKVELLEDEVLLEKTYRLLYEYNTELKNKKKAEEFGILYNLTKTAREKKELEASNKKKELLLKKNATAINTLKEENKKSESDKELAQQEVYQKSTELLITRDSLGILDLINSERQNQINLLNKEKQLKELKVKEQALLIKEKEAREHLTWVILGSLILGLITLSALAFYIYRNLQQKRKYSDQIESQLQIISHQHENITNSITYAQRIQNAMLPHEHSFHQLFPDSFILFKPKDIVSGDFYWFFNINTGSALNDYEISGDVPFNPSQKVLVAAVDCTGHGVPGAFMSMIAYNLLNMIVSKNIHEPDKILSELNRSVRFALQQYKNDNKDGMDMAICSIDQQNKIIEYAGAKNPLIIIKDGVLEHIKGDKDPIGGSQGKSERTYTKHTIAIDKPTTLYLLSDGYEDQFGGPEGKKFMIKNLKELLLNIHHEPFDKQKGILDKTIEDWKGSKEKQIDDILVMGLKVS
ncbi:MAG TPA: SpoIIE family protein phosphatase [Cytophagaceae bacterium]|nr:SpoIIE family protein phosphatase [Cytophagaceae bacterium]